MSAQCMHESVITSVLNTRIHPPSLWRRHNPRCPSFSHPEGTGTWGQGRRWVPLRRCLDRSTCSLPDCVWEGSPLSCTYPEGFRGSAPPTQPILSSLSCCHGSSCQGLPRLLRSGCGRLPGPVASRNRESGGGGKQDYPHSCHLSAVTGLVLGPLLSPDCTCDLYVAILLLMRRLSQEVGIVILRSTF